MNALSKKRPTFQNLFPDLRSVLAQSLRKGRLKDRQSPDVAGWLSQSRGMAEYFFCLGIMPAYLEQWLVQKSMKADVKVFEAGIGDFIFGRELVQRYGEWLSIDGLRLTYSKELRGQPGLRQKVGMLETSALAGPYDLAISARGGFVYSLDSFAAVEEVLRSLKPGGMAYVDDAKLLLPQAWFRAYLRKCGIEVEVTRYERGAPYAYRLKKNTTNPLDLSSFSDRYLEGLNENAILIREWGFDRTLRGSPLTELLASLYSEERYRDLVGSMEASGSSEAEVLEIGGVVYVNDAFSTTFEQVEASVARWRRRRIFWVAGGDQGDAAPPKLAVHAGLFFGARCRELAESWKDLAQVFTGQEIKDAMEKVRHFAKPGDVVLFSPGLPPEASVHGTCENRADDFRCRLAELRDLLAWGG